MPPDTGRGRWGTVADYALTLTDTEIARYRFMAHAALQTERDQWASAGVGHGARVADIGCGPGAVAIVLAGLVGASGTVHALDRDPAALAVARDMAKAAGATNIVCSEGAATDTGLAPGSVDVVMLRHVLAHNGGREQAIVQHLASLVRPGGCVYLVDIDATAMRMRPPENAAAMMEMAERYAQFHAGLGNDLSVGLRLGDLLERAGLEDVDHRGRYEIIRPRSGMRPPAWAARAEMLAAGVVNDDDLTRWQAEFDRLDRGEVSFTLFMSTFTAAARRPA